MMKQEKIWQLQQEKLIDKIDDFKKVIWQNRDWQNGELTEVFTLDKIDAQSVGIDEKELKKAIKRIATTKKKQEKVVIFGDYDVDGNCATAIMWLGLKEIGVKAIPFIPNRIKHGYGMSIAALEEICAKQKPDVIITVDNGISAITAIEWCKKNEIDVIVTDHHQRAEAKNPALAVVQTAQLSGAGVAWLVVKELLARIIPEMCETKTLALLDLVALATIVDQVPLRGINRLVTKEGMRALRQTTRPGIRALARTAEIEQKKMTGKDIGFGLGPKINAIGRLTNTLEALRLLCTAQDKLACQLAETLTEVNGTRQELTAEMIEIALAQIDQEQLPKVLIVASMRFHEGIIGLIASKLVDLYYRPAIVIAVGEETAKASARSIANFNITDFIRQFETSLIDVGGHAAAAGFSMRSENLEQLKKEMTKQGNKQLKNEDLRPKIVVEAPVTLKLLYDEQLPQLLEELEPFGNGNPELVVQVNGTVMNTRLMGSEQQHLKVDIADERGRYLPLLFWGWRDKQLVVPRTGEKLAAVGQLKIDEYRGNKKPTIVGMDMKIID